MLADQHFISAAAFIALRTRMDADISVETWRYLFGISATSWDGLLRDARQDGRRSPPVAPHIAVAARWIARHQDFCIPLSLPSPGDVFMRLRRVIGSSCTRRGFGMAFGYEASRGSEWLMGRSRPARGARLALAMIDHVTDRQLVLNWREWRSLAELEARLRGMPDLSSASRWTCPMENLPEGGASAGKRQNG